MWKKVVAAGGGIVIGGLIVAWVAIEYAESSIRADTANCQVLLATANGDIASVLANPQTSNVFCAAAKKNIKIVQDVCPKFSVLDYSAIVPPCK